MVGRDDFSGGASVDEHPREIPAAMRAANQTGASADEPRQPRGQMRHQAAVGVDTFLDVGQIAALDDAVEPFGAADQHPGLAARQRVGGQLPGRLVEGLAVEQLDIAGGVGQQQLDRLGLDGIGRVVDEPPEAGLAQTGRLVFAGVGQPPGPGLPVQIVAAVMGDDDLLAEPVVAVGIRGPRPRRATRRPAAAAPAARR